MSNIDKQALRQTAEKAQEHGVFNMDIHSQTVLALLDELEAKDKRDAELEDLLASEIKSWMQRYDSANNRREAAEKRIAELEAREVVLLSAHDVHPLGPQSAKIFCEFHRSIVNRCADEIRKVGVKVSIKGN